MNYKKILSLSLILCIAIMIVGTGMGIAESVYASPVFESGYIAMNKSLYTEFGASTKKICDEIYVSSCTLQEMDKNDKVISSTEVTPPSDVAKNTSNFTAWETYSGTSGKRYRMKAVFSADGYTITRYSRIVTCE
ncbi:hypothetical protein [Faecalimonas sp.]